MPIYKGDNNIESLYRGDVAIDSAYKGQYLVYENYKTVTSEGTPPLTVKAAGENLMEYKLYGNTAQKNMPDAYQQVEYIESDGNQYLNLGITTGSTTNFEIKMATTEANPTAIRRIFGGYASSGTWYELALSSSSNGIFLNYISGSNFTQYVPTINTPFVVKKMGTSLITPNGTVELGSGSFNNPSVAYLFASSRSGTSGFIGRIYYAKIFKNSNLILDLYPCYRKADNVIGMYDAISNTFFTNGGSGTFTKGSNVNPTAASPSSPIFIESVGDKVTSGTYNGKYRIPITVSNGVQSITTDIYLNAPLRKVGNNIDYIDSATGKVYRRVGEYVFDSTHYSFTATSSGGRQYFYRVIADVAIPYKEVFVTHYQGTGTFYSGIYDLQCTLNGGAYRSIYIRDDSYANGTTFSNFIKSLADNGTPMSLLYGLYTSAYTTETVTLPTLPSIKGQCTYTIGSALNASNMWIKYKGKNS